MPVGALRYGGARLASSAPSMDRVEGPRFQRAAHRQATGRLGVVVGVAGDPAQPQRCVGQHEPQYGGTVVEEGGTQVVGDVVAGDVREVGGGLVGCVGHALGQQHVVVGDPHAAAGPCRRPAEVRRLLDEHGAKAVVGGGKCGGHTGRAAADHDHVVLVHGLHTRTGYSFCHALGVGLGSGRRCGGVRRRGRVCRAGGRACRRVGGGAGPVRRRRRDGDVGRDRVRGWRDVRAAGRRGGGHGRRNDRLPAARGRRRGVPGDAVGVLLVECVDDRLAGRGGGPVRPVGLSVQDVVPEQRVLPLLLGQRERVAVPVAGDPRAPWSSGTRSRDIRSGVLRGPGRGGPRGRRARAPTRRR